MVTLLCLQLIAVGLLAGACTEANPGYLGGSGDNGGQLADGTRPLGDAARGFDGARPRDARSLEGGGLDAGPRPDQAPVGCRGPADCDDRLPCTADRCRDGVCAHTVRDASCLIDGVCYGHGDSNPADSCEVCATGQPRRWQPKDEGAPCEDDGLSCTIDRCEATVCRHHHDPSRGCLVGGTCAADGQADPSNVCRECVTASDSKDFTFIVGKPCGSATARGVCLRGSCRLLRSQSYQPPNASLTDVSLDVVAQIPASGSIWVGGRSTRLIGPIDSASGLLVEMGPNGPVRYQAVNQPVIDLSHRLALGEGGYYHYYVDRNAGWQQLVALRSKLFGRDRVSLWGATSQTGKGDIYYLGGRVVGSLPGVYRCELRSTVDIRCQSNRGVLPGTTIGALGGLLGPSGDPEAVWGFSFGSLEDIYFNDGQNSTWSNGPPTGCRDVPSQPCAVPGHFSDIKIVGAKDIWAVGSQGLLFHYDGSSWRALTNRVQTQSVNDFDAVYADTEVVLIFAHQDTRAGRVIRLLTHSRKIDRWYGPVTLEVFAQPQGDTRLLDIGGQLPGQLVASGRRPSSSSASRQTGWLLFVR